MIRSIKNFYNTKIAKGAESEATPENHMQLAAAALLFEVSRSDFSIDNPEREKIQELVQSQFDLSSDDAEVLTQLAEGQANKATSLHGFTSLINANWSMEQRVQLIEFMWRVAYADEHLDAHEIHLMRKIGSLLYVPQQQLVAAKLRAKQHR